MDFAGNGAKSMTLHLTEYQKDYIKGLAKHLPPNQGTIFKDVVLSRLGNGRPIDNTVRRVASLVAQEIKRGDILARKYQGEKNDAPTSC
jgi:hypothetical protein